jgi:ABC-2 type transport system permease protein
MGLSLSRLLHVVRKEFLELGRDPRLFGIVIIAPIMQLTLLGYAASTRAIACNPPSGSRTRR